MNAVFADSFYFIAILNSRDLHHAQANSIAQSLESKVVTTAWVLAEVGDALSAPAQRVRVAQFIRSLLRSDAIEVAADPSKLFEERLSLYENRPDKSWSLTDCISFSVMEARGIREALTGDHHFTQAGFVALLAPQSAN